VTHESDTWPWVVIPAALSIALSIDNAQINEDRMGHFSRIPSTRDGIEVVDFKDVGMLWYNRASDPLDGRPRLFHRSYRDVQRMPRSSPSVACCWARNKVKDSGGSKFVAVCL
jgi:hypothetical protein